MLMRETGVTKRTPGALIDIPQQISIITSIVISPLRTDCGFRTIYFNGWRSAKRQMLNFPIASTTPRRAHEPALKSFNRYHAFALHHSCTLGQYSSHMLTLRQTTLPLSSRP